MKSFTGPSIDGRPETILCMSWQPFMYVLAAAFGQPGWGLFFRTNLLFYLLSDIARFPKAGICRYTSLFLSIKIS